VIIVGDVAQARTAPNWFTARPLFGSTVLVTRPQGQADGLSTRLRELGAAVVHQPAIAIREPRDWAPVDAVIRRLADFGWLAFSSKNGVDYFLGRLAALGFDARQLGGVKLAAIGPATVAALAEHSLVADAAPDVYRAEALADLLAPVARGQRVLVVRASRGREVLVERLRAAGATVEQAVVYDSQDVAQADEEVAVALSAGRIDWTTVTSSAIARSLVRLFGETLRQTRLAAISPLTAGVLAEMGHTPAVVAARYTADGLVEAMLSHPYSSH
jgi:uroporphyrinogen III methyltransferase/synthase